MIGALTALIACGIDIGIEKIAEGKFLAIKAGILFMLTTCMYVST